MLSKVKLLKKENKYFFSVLHGLDIDTIRKLRCDYLGIKTIQLFSDEFDKLKGEIFDLGNAFPEEFRDFKYFKGHEISLLFYSSNENNLNQFLYFLILLRPSRIRKWWEFEAYYPDKDMLEFYEKKHTTNGESIWHTAIDLCHEFQAEDIFKLTDSDISFANQILKQYLVLNKNSSYKHFLSLYYRAYNEEADYFKYLLLFIIIESFIPADDKMGVTYKIRRFCAVIAGDNSIESQIIYDKTSDAYNVRSSLVHNAKNKLPEARYLQYLHSLVCELGILVLIGNLDKETLFNITTAMGFGQRNELLKNTVFKKYKNITMNSVNFYLLEKPKKSKKEKLTKAAYNI